MKSIMPILFFTALVILMPRFLNAQQSLDFEQSSLGEIPKDWKIEATKHREPLATWKIIRDETVSSGKQVLALTNVSHGSGGTFNLCWTGTIQFKDGEIEVGFRAVDGYVDQGGGPIWRVQDANNYYIARVNPLEDNFRVYYVKNGSRRQLASARVKAPSKVWHTIKIVHQGRKIIGHFNGQKLIEIEDDTFPLAGGIGLWTKADAVTSFDDFSIILKD